MTISGFAAYQTFIALKNHFTLPSYDYVKYNGKTSAKVATYVKRKDRFFFEKLGRMVDSQNQLVNHIIANLTYGSNGLQVDPAKVWIGDMTTSVARDRALQFEGFQQALEYNIRKEFCIIKDFIRVRDESMAAGNTEEERPPVSSFPLLLTLYYEGEIRPDTIVILNTFLDLNWEWDKKLKGDPIWEKTRTFLGKYRVLVHPNLDVQKYKFMYRQVLLEKNTI